MTKEQKKISLVKYAETLKQRLRATVFKSDAFKQMLEIDLRKTLSKIETL
jgi:hypothetical protein